MSNELELKLESKVFSGNWHPTKLAVTIDKGDEWPINIDLEPNAYTINEAKEIVEFLNKAIKKAEHVDVFGLPGI